MSRMNAFLKMLSLISIAFLISCSDDNSGNPTPVPGSQYADQNLQGTVFAANWMLESGTVISIENGADPGNYLHIFTLRSELDSNICSKTNGGLTSYSLPGERYLNIILETDVDILEEGFYNFGEAGTLGVGAFYFYDSTDSVSTSQVGATNGSMLITKVDTDTGIVEGSLVAIDEDFDTNSNVDGNFQVNYCRP